VRRPSARPRLAATTCALLLALVFAAGLSACGDDDAELPEATTTPAAGPASGATATEPALTVATASATAALAPGETSTARAPAAATTAGTRSTATVTPGAGPATGTVAVATEPITVPGPTTAR
jgi:hypothetical protein